MAAGGQPQPHAPPQPPPPGPPEAPEPDGPAERPRPEERPPTETADSSLTVSSWPCGQVDGADDSVIGRVSSNVSPQARQRYSYRGTGAVYALPARRGEPLSRPGTAPESSAPPGEPAREGSRPCPFRIMLFFEVTASRLTGGTTGATATLSS